MLMKLRLVLKLVNTTLTVIGADAFAGTPTARPCNSHQD